MAKKKKTKYNGETIYFKSHVQHRSKKRAGLNSRVVSFSKKALKDGIGLKEAIDIANMSFRKAQESGNPEEIKESLKKRDLVSFIERKTKNKDTLIKIYGYDVFVFVKNDAKTLLTLPDPLKEHWDFYSRNVLKVKREEERRLKDEKYGRCINDSNV